MFRTAIAALIAAGLCTTVQAASFSTDAAGPQVPTGGEPAGAACGTVVLTQNSNNVPVQGNSVSCNNGQANGSLHADNSYFRAFSLGAFPNGFNTCAVEFGIENANAAGTGTTQPVVVNVYANTGAAFPGGTRTLVGTANADVPDQALSLFSVPLTAAVPAGAELVAEVFTPDGQTAGHSFFIGSNTSPETGPSYIQAATCGLTSPQTTGSINFANMRIILNVVGDGPAADLAITKDDGVTTVAAGGSTTYTITATNPAGGVAASPVTITDTFPADLTCTWTSTATGGATGNTASGSGNINDTTVSMPAGSTVTYTATCAVSATATGTIANTATVSVAGDPNTENNAATDTDTVVSGATVTGTKTASSGSVAFGQSFAYTIVLANTGAGAQADNAGNEFTDVLPAGVTGNSVSATSGTATLAGNTVNWNGAIPAGGSVTITINATLTGGASGATIVNQGTISYDSNGDGTNDATAATDDPSLPGAADATGIVVSGAGGAVQSVPVDARWALLLLALGLGLVATRRLHASR